MASHSRSVQPEEHSSGVDPAPSTAQDFDYFDKVVAALASPDSGTASEAIPDKAQVLAALEHICASAAFRGSRRSQQFLRYIVEQTLHGHADELKERAIAMEVFGRGTDFEPGEDSLVRVKARELRKRLDAFYDSNAQLHCRIDLPLGGYIPRFIAIPQTTPQPTPDTLDLAAVPPAPHSPQPDSPSAPWSRRRLLASSASLLGALTLGGAALWQKTHSPESALDKLWKPIFQTGTPLVIFIPVLKDRTTQEVTDRIGIGPAQALRRVADFLNDHHYPYHLRFGSEMNFALLKEQPSLLLGGFSSTWTAFMTKGLRFTMLWDEVKKNRAIVDAVSHKSWSSINPTRQGYADMDYGLLTRLFDRETGQISMIAGGLTTFGTEAAAEVLFNAADFDQVLKSAPPKWQQMNFQVVVQSVIVGTTPSHPSIVAVHFW